MNEITSFVDLTKNRTSKWSYGKTHSSIVYLLWLHWNYSGIRSQGWTFFIKDERINKLSYSASPKVYSPAERRPQFKLRFIAVRHCAFIIVAGPAAFPGQSYPRDRKTPMYIELHWKNTTTIAVYSHICHTQHNFSRIPVFFEILRFLLLSGRIPTTQVSLVWGGPFIALLLIFSHHDFCPLWDSNPGPFVPGTTR